MEAGNNYKEWIKFMNRKHEALFRPIKIGGTELKNRLILTAMGGTAFFDHTDKNFNEGILDYYIDRCKGGVGLIIPGVVQIKSGSHYLYEQEKIFKGPIKEAMKVIHSYGTKYFMQLGAGFGRTQLFGIDSDDPEVRNTLLVAPSDGVPNVWVPELKHRELRRDEIHEIVKAFGKTALLCREAGIDGIEIHAVHEGYLLDQFSMSCTNSRSDEYGGSLENRLRFCCEIIKEIHDVCGRDYPVSVRYSVASKMRGFNQGALPLEDYKEFGRSLEESPRAARILEAAGADMLDADNGTYDSWWWAHPPVYMPLHCNFPEVSFIKKYVSIPVFCAGRMEDPDFAAKAIENGEIDGIGLARQLLADPYWMKKVEDEKLDEIRPCIACHNGCFPIGKIPVNDGRDFIMSHCALRPATMAEKKWEIKPAEVKKKVAVVGGGIGGMECARILTKRGHSVTLFEKSGELGGVFIAAAAPSFKEKDKMLISWYIRQMELCGVDVKLNTKADCETLSDFDTVVCATGSSPRKLSLPGIDDEKVMEAIEYLRGTKQTGERVVIIGGGLTGVEIAYQLILDGKKPQIVEMQDDILQVPGLCAANSDFLREVIRLNAIPVHTGAKFMGLRDGCVSIDTPDGEKLIEADSVILSVGYVPDTSLCEKLSCSGKETVLIGDAKRVGNLMNAVYDACRAAFEI